MLLDIVTGSETKILRTVCEPVTQFDKSLKKLAEDMIETMHAAKGLGIAAPQVGVNARVFIVTFDYGQKDERQVAMVNPEIIFFSDNQDLAEEGCLSLPKVFGNVERPTEIVVKYLNLRGQELSLRLEGLNARVVQHELDHLNGVLFIDKLAGPVVM